MNSKSNVVKTFVATTSIKGVSPIARAQSNFLRILWSIAVLIGLCVGIYFTIELLREFFSYSVVVRTKKKDYHATFPDVTICPLNPLSNMIYDNIKTRVKEFEDATQRMENLLNENNDIKHIVSVLESPGNIFININISDVEMNYDNWINMTLDCKWYLRNSKNIFPCFENVYADLYQVDLGFCQTFRAPERHNSPEALGLIVFMKDSAFNFQRVKLKKSRPFASGVRVMVHDQGTLPNIDKGTNIPMGFYAEVMVSQSVFKKLDYPYSDCEMNPEYPNEYKFKIGDRVIKYDYNLCVHGCIQYQIMKNCSCVDGDKTSTRIQRGNLTFCRQFVDKNETQKEGYFDIIKKIKCIQNIEANDDGLCHSRCPIPCNEIDFSITNNLVEWPHTADKLAFYKDYIMGTEYEYHMDGIYKDLIKNISNQKLKLANDMRVNFANIQVMLASRSIMEYSDAPSMTVFSMVGSLGGNLNLWIGITLFTIVELSDFLYRILFLKKSPENIETNQNSKLTINIETTV